LTEKISGRVVRPGAVLPGYVTVDGPTIVSVTEQPDAGPDIIVPGFVDLHCHGGGGHTFTEGDPEAARAAAAFHRRHGTTTLLASLVSSPAELMRDATAAYRPLVAAGELAGIHFEGPYLAHSRCGAQNPAFLRDPSPDELAALVKLGEGAVRMMTIAPELPGALDAIAYLAGQGVVAAIGHTDATYEETLAGIAAGATVGTHLCNAMRPVHHREPGPVIALLEDPRVTVELITDGVHLHPALYRDVAHTAGPDRVALVTDAMVAAGMPDGGYHLGGLAVTVADGVARLAGSETIAGSTATMDAIFRYAVANSALPVDLALLQAVRQTSVNPAAALGLPVAGLATGRFADLVVLDANLGLRSVLARGEWVIGRPGAAAG
jgi:N-acetylglucosamine-6-phosphate deacetylase